MRFALLALLLAGCSPALRAQLKERRDVRTLGEAAGAYWMAIRWNDPAGAAPFLETPEERLRLGRLVSEPAVRITDVAVVNVVVGAELPEERLPEKREGIALVRL